MCNCLVLNLGPIFQMKNINQWILKVSNVFLLAIMKMLKHIDYLYLTLQSLSFGQMFDLMNTPWLVPTLFCHRNFQIIEFKKNNIFLL
jgi:hypothetical protein